MNRSEVEKHIRKDMVWIPLIIYVIMLVAYLVIGVLLSTREDYAIFSCVLLCVTHLIYSAIDILYMHSQTTNAVNLTKLTETLLEDRSPYRKKWKLMRLLLIIGSLVFYVLLVMILGRLTDRNKIWWALISPYNSQTLYQPALSFVLILGCIIARYFQFLRPLNRPGDLNLMRTGKKKSTPGHASNKNNGTTIKF